MATLALASVALPAAAAGLGNVIPASQDSIAANGGVFSFSEGSSGSDVVSNAVLLAALDSSGLLYALCNKTFTDISGGGANALLQFQSAFIALGGHLDIVGLGIASGLSALAFACASGSKVTLAATTTAATGYFRIALTPSIAS